MTVKIPMRTPVSEPKSWSITPAWSNFCISRMTPFENVLHTDKIKEALKEYNAVWLRSEGKIEFETDEDALMWVLRWS